MTINQNNRTCLPTKEDSNVKNKLEKNTNLIISIEEDEMPPLYFPQPKQSRKRGMKKLNINKSVRKENPNLNIKEKLTINNIKPGTSLLFKKRLSKQLKYELNNIIELHDGNLNCLDWINVIENSNEIEEKDMLDKICEINSDILQECLREIFDNITNIHDENEYIHDKFINKSREMSDLYLIGNFTSNEKKIYFSYLQMLCYSHDKTLFMAKYDEFFENILKEITNELFQDDPYYVDFPVSLNKFKTHNQKISLNEAFLLLGITENYKPTVDYEMATNKIMHLECKNNEIASFNFYHEEFEILNQCVEFLYEIFIKKICLCIYVGKYLNASTRTEL
ncbi:hypothetical protein HZS_2670 [Henneguya salminicola]|nr:hypothetical protein HZS_2670 [Henneguya salminicola]